MASNRHLGRIIALQTLYEQDFREFSGDKTFDADEVLQRNIERYKSMIEDLNFIRQLVHGVIKQTPQLDDTLRPIAPEWPIEQIARIDRVVLRIGLYELSNEPDVPAKVVINEAVELAKAFGSDNSSKFVNGVLGTALRQQEAVDQKSATKTSSATKKTTSGSKTTKSKTKPAKKVANKKD